MIARRQIGQVSRMLGRGVKFLCMEQDIVAVEDHVLHHHVRRAFEHRIWRWAACINFQHLLSVARDVLRLTPFRPPFRRVPFRFQGVVLGGRLRRVGFDRGLALLTLESGDFVAQALVFRLRCPQLSHDVFEPVEQRLNEFARAVIRDAVQVKVFKHVQGAPERRGHTCRESLCLLSPILALLPATCSHPPGLLRRYLLVPEGILS